MKCNGITSLKLEYMVKKEYTGAITIQVKDYINLGLHQMAQDQIQ